MSLKIELINGITLFKLLRVLSITGLLALLGYVKLIQVMSDQAVRSVRDRFSHALHFARAEAIYSQKFVTICPTSDQYGCDGNWSNGWIIFFDEDGSGSRESEQERLINSASGEASVVINGNSEDPIMFNPFGKHLGGSQYFDICPNNFLSQHAQQRIKLTALVSTFYPVSAIGGEYCNI